MMRPRIASTLAAGLGLAALLGVTGPATTSPGRDGCPTVTAAVERLEAGLPTAPLPEIETFMQIGAAARPVLSPDGRTLYFVSGASGTSQLYRVLANGWPYQITFIDQGVDNFQFNPACTHAVLLVDVNGNENHQFLLLDARTGSLRPLTDAPEVRHLGGIWSHDGLKLYYSANDTDRASFHIHEMDLLTGSTRRLVAEKGSNGAVDVSPDGRRLIYYATTTSLDNNLYLYDLGTGESTLITPHEGEHSYYGGVFSGDGRYAYVISDDNPDGIRRLARIDLSGPRMEYVLTNDSRWEVETFSISDDRRFLAWITNEEGYGRIHLHDLERNRDLPSPDLDGIAGSPVPIDAGFLAFSYNSPTRTADIWIWDFRSGAGLGAGSSSATAARVNRSAGGQPSGTGGIALPPMESWLSACPEPGYGAGPAGNPVQVTFSSYAGIDPDIFEEPKLIHYPSFDGTEIPAFLYVPPGWDGKPIPFIIDAHGGPTGQFRPFFNRHFQYLMQHGFGLFAPNFRGSTGYGREFEDADNYKKRLDSVHDVAEGAKWLIANDYAESGQIGIKGASYGGYMTLAAMTEYPELFGAGLDQVGIANFETFLERTADYRRSLRESEYGPLDDREFLQSISPIHKVDRIKGALLVVHGEHDPRVPVSEARQILAAVAAHGTPVDSLIFPDEGHGIAQRVNRLVFYRKMVEFFKAHLGS